MKDASISSSTNKQPLCWSTPLWSSFTNIIEETGDNDEDRAQWCIVFTIIPRLLFLENTRLYHGPLCQALTIIDKRSYAHLAPPGCECHTLKAHWDHLVHIYPKMLSVVLGFKNLVGLCLPQHP